MADPLSPSPPSPSPGSAQTGYALVDSIARTAKLVELCQRLRTSPELKVLLAHLTRALTMSWLGVRGCARRPWLHECAAVPASINSITASSCQNTNYAASIR